MNKRHLHHVWRTYRRLKPWYFIVAVLVFGGMSLLALRHNNDQMLGLRDAVYAADKDNGDVEGSLRQLRQYVYSHMNTGLATGPNAVHPPIQLKYTYERLQAQQQQGAVSQGNNAVYEQARQTCESQTSIGSEVITCIQNYANQHGAQLAQIPDDLYKFDFTSTKWSFDLAGWSIILTAIAMICFVISAAYHWWAKRYL